MNSSQISTVVLMLGLLVLGGCNAVQPIHTAALEGDLVKVRELAHKGNNINQKSSAADSYEGFTPLHMAINNGHKDVALYLIKGGAQVNVAGKIGRTPLHLAAYNGMPQVAKLLVSRGGNVKASSSDGATPLHSAAISIKNNIQLLELLLSKGADVNSGRGTKIGTPLILAAKYGDVDVARILVNNGADINAQDASGNSALHIASQFGRLDFVNYLLIKNPDVNLVNSDNNSPLHVAAMNGRRVVAEQLVYHGANLIGKNSAGKIPLDCAKNSGKDTIVALLEPFTETDSNTVESKEEGKIEPSILAD
jgi:ankyrin repeat protein